MSRQPPRPHRSPHRVRTRLATLSLMVGGLAVVAALPAAAAAQAAGASVPGVVVKDVVEVKSSPGDQSYAVMHLTAGQEVTAVGLKFDDWLMIEPPEGSYCLVPEGWVRLDGDADFPTQGTALRDLNVKIASRVNQNRWDVGPSRIPANTQLTILGKTEDSYFKIPPPADVVYYVRKDAILPKAQTAAATTPDPATNVPDGPDDLGPPMQVTTADDEGDTPADDVPEGTVAEVDDRMPLTDDPAEVTMTPDTPSDPVADALGTDPAMPTVSTPEASDAFLALEERYAAATRKGVEEQDEAELGALAEEYETLVQAGGLGEADLQMAALRTSGLDARRKALAEYREIVAQRAEREAEEAAYEAERAELETRAAAGTLRQYTAVGMVRGSVLKLDGRPLFRLVDPGNNHTLLYLRDDSTAGGTPVSSLVGQFVGVDGEVREGKRGTSLQYLVPQAIEPVSPDTLYNGVTATIVPPTMTRG